MYEGLVERTWVLSDLMCRAARAHLFTTLLVADAARGVLALKKGWAGGEPEEPGCAPYVGPPKAMELLVDLDSAVAITPTGNPLGCGWMGSVRRYEPEWTAHLITSASAWSERCDAQHALVLNYAISHEVRFHHVGFRHPTPGSMLKAVEGDQERYGVSAIAAPAADHKRYYVPVKTEAHPNGVYWREHQYFPEGEKTYAVHWDLATISPVGLLDFIAQHLGASLVTWEAGPNDPVGVVWQENRGVPYGIMARDRWWEVE